MTATVLRVVVPGICIWSQSVLRWASVSVALIVRPREGTALAQCGRRRVTGLRKTRPCGPHITRGDSIASPIDAEILINNYSIFGQDCQIRIIYCIFTKQSYSNLNSNSKNNINLSSLTCGAK